MPDRERERETDNCVLYHPFISIVSILGCLHRNSDWSMGDIPGITMPRTSYGRGFLYERSLDIGVKDRLHFWTFDMPLPEEPFTYPDQDLCWILMIFGGWRDETLNDRDQQWLKNIRCKYVNCNCCYRCYLVLVITTALRYIKTTYNNQQFPLENLLLRGWTLKLAHVIWQPWHRVNLTTSESLAAHHATSTYLVIFFTFPCIFDLNFSFACV